MIAAIETSIGYRPRLRADVAIGPPEYINGEVMHQAKHRVTGTYFRMGEREVFLLQRMDGARTLDEIAAEYSAHVGRTVRAAALQAALELFDQRGLLEGGTEPRPLPVNEEDEGTLGMFSGKLWHFNPDATMARIAPWSRWLVNAPVMLLWAALVLAAEVAIAMRLPSLWKDFTSLPASSLLLRAACLSGFAYLTMAIHECGHAIACKRYGGEVREMGFLFRYFSVCAYTRIDDIMLLANRWHRVIVLLIGPLISLSVVPLAYLLAQSTAPGTRAHIFAVDIALWYNAGILLQLIPFLQFDGYFMMAQLLHMPDLRKDASRYLATHLLSRVTNTVQPMRIAAGTPRIVPILYVLYGVLAAVVTTAAVALLLREYGRSLVRMIGTIPSAVIAALLVCVVARKLYVAVRTQLAAARARV